MQDTEENYNQKMIKKNTLKVDECCIVNVSPRKIVVILFTNSRIILRKIKTHKKLVS